MTVLRRCVMLILLLAGRGDRGRLRRQFPARCPGWPAGLALIP